MSFVHLLRHAQSTFNVIYDRTQVDPIDFDAPLSDNGRRQAKETRRSMLGMVDIDLVVTSPLTRAIETALVVFRDYAPIVVESQHREWQYNSCDVVRRCHY